MSKIINVEQEIKFEGYDSFTEAVIKSKDIEEKELMRSSINGKVVTSYKFNGSVLVICFENKFYLTVSAGRHLVEWEVVENPPNIENVSKEDNIIFEFPSGNRMKWECLKILDSLVGKQVAISSSNQLLFIFYRSSPEYLFDVVVKKDMSEVRYLTLSEA